MATDAFRARHPEPKMCRLDWLHIIRNCGIPLTELDTATGENCILDAEYD
jgi:hypothetical protein